MKISYKWECLLEGEERHWSEGEISRKKTYSWVEPNISMSVNIYVVKWAKINDIKNKNGRGDL